MKIIKLFASQLATFLEHANFKLILITHSPHSAITMLVLNGPLIIQFAVCLSKPDLFPSFSRKLIVINKKISFMWNYSCFFQHFEQAEQAVNSSLRVAITVASTHFTYPRRDDQA